MYVYVLRLKQIFGLIFIIQMLNWAANYMYLFTLWSGVYHTKLNHILSITILAVSAKFKATCTHFRAVSEVVPVNQLKVTSFYTKYAYFNAFNIFCLRPKRKFEC